MARIVLLVPVFPKRSETFILQKFLSLLARGWDVHVLCFEHSMTELKNHPKLNRRADLQRRIHVIWPTHPRILAALLFPFVLLQSLIFAPATTLRYMKRGWQRFGVDILRRFYLDAKLIALQPHVIHFEFGSLAASRMYLKELLSSKLVVSFRGYDLNFVGLEEPGYYRPVWKFADALHLLGEDLWKRAQKRGCPPERLHTLIPPAIDTDFFTPQPRTLQTEVGTLERPLRLLSVGRLEWKKGYEHAFEAVHLLAAQGVVCEYHVVGDGEQYEALAFALHQMHLKSNVQLMGWQTPEEVREQMTWADIFLHSAVSEGFCNAVIEAQAMRLPVVSSDADGLSENVQDGLTGFVTARRNPQSMAEHLARLASDPDLRFRMGKAGRERVKTLFQLPDQITKFERLYSQVLGETR